MPNNETKPAPLGLPTPPTLTHDGILTLTPPAPIGPIGLKSGNAKRSTASLGEQVLTFARRQHGRRVGSGECFDLADRALRHAGAKHASDYGEITASADYVWGREVNLADIRPGDIIQFRDYHYRLEKSDGSWEEEQERPHHTAVVESIDEHDKITVLEQNAPPGSNVHRIELYLSSTSFNERNIRITITVQGQVWFYRPEPND
jgi:hypothetical protein